MSRHFGGNYTWHSGTAGEDGSVAGILTDRELAAAKVDHALIGIFEAGAWRPEIRVPWSGVAALRVTLPSPAWVIVGHDGRALVADGSGIREEVIAEGGDAARRVGLLRGGRTIGGHAVAVGMDRQVWLRKDAGDWRAIDRGCRLAPGDPAITGLEAVDGFDLEDLWAVGWHGEIRRRMRGTWRTVPSPTNLILTNLCCAPDGRVWICGRCGTLLVAEGERVRAIEHEGPGDDFWGVAWLDGYVYLATFYALYRFDPRSEELAPVEEEDAPSSCYHLQAVDGRLWSFGPFEVALRDALGWQRFD